MSEKKKISLFKILYKIFLAGGYIFYFFAAAAAILFIMFKDAPARHSLPGNYIIMQAKNQDFSSIISSKKETVLDHVREFGFCSHYVYGMTKDFKDFVLNTKTGEIAVPAKTMDGIDFSKYPKEQAIGIIEMRNGNMRGIGWNKCY